MESEKVKEIKKVIQETIDGKLSTEYLTVCEISCCPRLDIDKLFSDILTLINELESENEKLKQHKRELQGGQQDLTKRIAELEKEKKEHGKKKFLRGWKLGIEEFSERLKEKVHKRDYVQGYAEIGLCEEIDETLKELIHEK